MKVQFYIGCTTRKGINLDQGAMFRRAAFILKEKGYGNCTAHMGYGHWNGQFEQCMVLTVIHHHSTVWMPFAEKFAAAFDQESVLCLIQDGGNMLVSNPRIHSDVSNADDDAYPFIIVGTQAGADAPIQYYVLNALTGWESSERHSRAAAAGQEALNLLHSGGK